MDGGKDNAVAHQPAYNSSSGVGMSRETTGYR